MTQQYEQILVQIQASKDKNETAVLMIELAEHAERNPMLQETLRKIKLKPPFDIFEYVKCYNKKGFWRRTRPNREFPSVAEAEFRLEASKINAGLFGTKGVVDMLDGTRIPLRDYIAGEMMRGRKFISDEARDERERNKTIDRIVRTIS